MTPAVIGLAHLPGETQLCAESLLRGPEAAWLSARCCVPGLSPSSGLNIWFPFCEELVLACSILQCDVWCSADTPLKVPGKQSDTGTVDFIKVERCGLKFSTQANLPTSKYQVFEQCIKPADPWGLCVSVTPLGEGADGFLLLCITCCLWSFEHSRK